MKIAVALILAQLIILILFAATSTIWRVFDDIRRTSETQKQENYREALLNWVLELEPSALQHVRVLVDRSDRSVFQKTLVALIMTFKEKERILLCNMYIAKGFLAEDYQKLRSRRWWIRLSAVWSIECVGDQSSVGKLAPLFNDSRREVAIAAFLAASRIVRREHCQPLLERLCQRFPERSDVLIEVLRRISERYEDAVVDFLQQAKVEQEKSASITVLGMKHSFLGHDAIVNVLKSKGVSVLLVRKAIAALASIGDPFDVELLRPFLKSSESSIAGTALRALRALDPDEFERLIVDAGGGAA